MGGIGDSETTRQTTGEISVVVFENQVFHDEVSAPEIPQALHSRARGRIAADVNRTRERSLSLDVSRTHIREKDGSVKLDDTAFRNQNR